MVGHIRITSPKTGDVVVLDICGSLRVTTDHKIARRFGLKIGVFKIFEESGDGGICAEYKRSRDEKRWYLKSGVLYVLHQNGARQSTLTNARPSQLPLISPGGSPLDPTSPRASQLGPTSPRQSPLGPTSPGPS
ncbi:unnamed protein product [Calypogeia fissa]